MRYIAIGLSCVLIAAHFLRDGVMLAVVLCLALPLLLLIRAAWPAVVVRVFLSLAAVEWLRTLRVLIDQRQAADEPWFRMAAILVAVTLFTLGSAWLVRPRSPSHSDDAHPDEVDP